jgi:hypothetical protein
MGDYELVNVVQLVVDADVVVRPGCENSLVDALDDLELLYLGALHLFLVDSESVER